MDYLSDLQSRIAGAVAAGYTVSSIAKQAGLSRSLVSDVLNGHRQSVRLSTAQTLANLCDTLRGRPV